MSRNTQHNKRNMLTDFIKSIINQSVVSNIGCNGLVCTCYYTDSMKLIFRIKLCSFLCALFPYFAYWTSVVCCFLVDP